MASVDTTTSGDAQRTLRADARRNRERVLAAASAAFAEQGFDVGVAEIARRAGVGTGTLFRHFPTKLELEVAVVLERSAPMREVLSEALAEPDPWKGFAQALTRAVEITAADRCLGQAAKGPDLIADPRIQALRDELMSGFETLLARGREAGVVRSDLVATDLPVLVTAVGTTMEQFGSARPDLWRRYLGVVLDGLRAAGARALETAPPTVADLDASCVPPSLTQDPRADR